MAELIAIDEARRRVLEAVRPLPGEPVALDAALGRVLAEELASSLDVPPFESSAMDGYAVAAGPAAELPVAGESRAGRPFAGPLRPGTAVRISTGAEVPEGANAVVPVERASQTGANGSVSLPATTRGENVRHPGEDVRAGDVVLGPGTALGPAEVAVAASLGRTELTCALAGADVVCVSGGVSVGPHDHVKAALRELGVEERFWGVRLKPGKPTWFGCRDGVLVFGLPGNPVSAMVTFQLFHPRPSGGPQCPPRSGPAGAARARPGGLAGRADR